MLMHCRQKTDSVKKSDDPFIIYLPLLQLLFGKYYKIRSLRRTSIRSFL